VAHIPYFYPHTSTKCILCIYKQAFSPYSFFILSCHPFSYTPKEKQEEQKTLNQPSKESKTKEEKKKCHPFSWFGGSGAIAPRYGLRN